MYMLNILPTDLNQPCTYASCTYEYFIRANTTFPVVDFFGLKYQNMNTPPYTISATAMRQFRGGDGIHIRCVKDVSQ